MSDLFVKHYIDHEIRRVLDALEDRMSQLSDKLAEMTAAYDAAFARIDEDVAELRRKIEEGTATPDDLATIQAHIDRAKAHDLDPAFPAPEPEPTVPADGGDDTVPAA